MKNEINALLIKLNLPALTDEAWCWYNISACDILRLIKGIKATDYGKNWKWRRQTWGWQ
jgi:hypothetical protein